MPLSHSLAPRRREGLILSLLVAFSVLGCFKEPQIDVVTTRRCESNKNCPYGFVCGPNGTCCASSNGTTCNSVPSTGGAGPQIDGPQGSGGGQAVDGPGAGAGGTGGAGGAVDVRGPGGAGDGGLDLPIGGTGGSGVGSGGAMATGGLNASGGVIGSGGAIGPGGINGSGGVVSSGGVQASGGVVGTGGTVSSGGVPGTGGAGSGGTTTLTCSGTQKLCNGACIAASECCGGCSGNKPVCDNGTCVGNPNGTACTTSGAAACASGICADGVCCDATCDGNCESCNQTTRKGTCAPTTTARTACTSDGTSCGGSCDGTEAHRKTCTYPTSKCADQTCQSGTQTYAKMCDGAGHCAAPTPATKSCSPYACADATTCSSNCPNGQDTCGGTSCVALNTAAHCGNCSTSCTSPRNICTGSACVQCTGDSNCSGSTPACNTGTGTCVRCMSDTHCAGATGTTRCNTATNTCVQCTASSQCPTNAPICYNNACVECTVAGECPAAKPVCSNRTCLQCTGPVDCQNQGYGANSVCSSNVCSCHPQSTGNKNLLPNAGFNAQNTSGWTVPVYSGIPDPPGALGKYDGTKDVDGCASSGALRLAYYGFAFGSAHVCLATSSTVNHRFGYRFQQVDTSNSDAVRCALNFYTRSDCDSAYVLDGEERALLSGAPVAAGTWGAAVTNLTIPSGTAGIKVECTANSLQDVWVDQLFLGTQVAGAEY